MTLNHRSLPTESIVLCVCTRNRERYIEMFLNHLDTFTFVPKVCLVVDSSDNRSTERITRQFASRSRINIRYVSSLPGLPHQRNVGISYIRAHGLLTPSGIVSFLDDDVKVLDNYFEKVNNLFHEYPNAIGIGGYMVDNSKIKVRSMGRRLAFIGGDHGSILKSGIALPPVPKSRMVETEWIQGGMQNLRFKVFEQHLYDGRIRMYGEDVEFYSRISHLGTLLCSLDLPVHHLEGLSGKDDLREIESFTDGFRWSLATKKRANIRKYAVIHSTLALALGSFFFWIFRFDIQHKQRLFGHIDFFFRLIRRRELEQLVNHIGTGPHPVSSNE